MSQSATQYVRPRVDILAGDADYLIRADLPGVSADDLDLRVEAGFLTVLGRREHRPAFRRRFSIPRHTDVNAVTAEVRDGVLEVTVPKTETARARTIPVGVA
jgi:HSP20 family protein